MKFMNLNKLEEEATRIWYEEKEVLNDLKRRQKEEADRDKNLDMQNRVKMQEIRFNQAQMKMVRIIRFRTRIKIIFFIIFNFLFFISFILGGAFEIIKCSQVMEIIISIIFLVIGGILSWASSGQIAKILSYKFKGVDHYNLSNSSFSSFSSFSTFSTKIFIAAILWLFICVPLLKIMIWLVCSYKLRFLY